MGLAQALASGSLLSMLERRGLISRGEGLEERKREKGKARHKHHERQEESCRSRDVFLYWCPRRWRRG